MNTSLTAKYGSQRRLGLVALGGLMAFAGVLIVVLGDRLSFFNDDWYFLFQRPGMESHAGIDIFLAPHNSNLVLVPAIVYKALVGLFGLSSQLPFRIVLAICVVLLGPAVYKLVSDRVGVAFGLGAAAIVMLLGAAWEDLLFFASIDLVGSLVAGLFALVALRKDTRRANTVACALLTVSVCCSNVGLAFACGAVVCVLLRRRPGQLWIAAVPILVFVAWWLAYGRDQPSHVALSNVGHLPRYVLDSLETTMASLTGLNAGTVPDTYVRGRILLIVVLMALVVWVIRGGRPRPAALVALTALLAFWVLTCLGYTPGREPFASRYQLIDAALALVLAAEIVPMVRPRAVVSGIAIAAATAIVIANLTVRLDAGYHFLLTQRNYVKTDVGVLQAVRPRIPADLMLTPSVAGSPYLTGITGSRYLAETAAHRVPSSFSIRQILSSTPHLRQSADGVLAATEQLRPARVASARATACRRIVTAPGQPAQDAIARPGSLTLKNPGQAVLGIAVRRFAPAGVVTPIAFIGPGTSERLRIPRDRLPLTWHLQAVAASSSAALVVCGA
jgi:hypothetical protein